MTEEFEFVCKHCGHVTRGPIKKTAKGKHAGHVSWCDRSNRKVIERPTIKKNKIKNSDWKSIMGDKIRAKHANGEYVAAQSKTSLKLKGRTHTQESRKNMSIGCLKSKHRRLVRKCRNYTTVDGHIILLDSSWEECLAKRLDSLSIRWIRPSPLNWVDANGKLHNYFPDFYLLDYDIFLDPKNPSAMIAQHEKVSYIKTHYANVFFINTLEGCTEFDLTTFL